MNPDPAIRYTNQTVVIEAANGAKAVYDRGGRFKPHIPFLAPAGGRSIVLPSPYDHTFHRGLFFCWQRVNGAAAWYDREDGGGAYRWETTRFAPTFATENEVGLAHECTWVLSESGESVLADAREIRFRFQEDGSLHLDFDLSFRALADEVTLSANKPFQKEGESVVRGGYGGFGIRLPRAWKRDVFPEAGVFADGGRNTQHEAHAAECRWAASHGPTDFGREWAGVLLVDHPGNPRHPMTLFARDEGNIAFLNAAITYREPITLGGGESLRLRYRVVVYPGHREPEDLERLAADYCGND